MNILSLDGVSKTLVADTLFRDVSLGIEENSRFGLVGRNGCGKSTFLKLLCGILPPDTGSMAKKRDLAITMLPQLPIADAGDTLGSFLWKGDAPLIKLARQYQDAMAAGKTQGSAANELHERMDRLGGFGLEQVYASLCTELGLSADPTTPMAGMSGGMIKKAALARALSAQADLVLLDEPTNHLDLESIEWLERKLNQARFAFILVTHDRAFLENTCTGILEIDRQEVHAYPGDYRSYLEMRAERYNALESADRRRQAILKIEMKWLNRGARARATKSERRKEGIRQLKDDALERPDAMGAFSSVSRRLGKRVLELDAVSKSYDGRLVFSPFSYEFVKGDRLGVVGPNGCGKSTLLGLIAGSIAPDSGSVMRGDNTQCAYFGQTAASLPAGDRVIDYIRRRAEITTLGNGAVLDPERLLERFLFDRTMHDQRLSTLSGGELRRLQLVATLAENPNLLVLDEPTNDLDVDTIELLEDYIDGFDGCVIVVSHDRAFLDGVTETTIAFDGKGAVQLFPGCYSDYREAAAELLAEAKPRIVPDAAKKPSARDGKERPRKATWAERKEYEGILDQIDALEAEKASCEAVFGSPAGAEELKEASLRYAELEKLIAERTARWEELSALVEEA